MELALKFRQEALASGLLRRKGDQDQAQSNIVPSNVEFQHAGVSLAFLEELAVIIKDLHETFHVPESTADVVQHILMPGFSQSKPAIGKTRLWDYLSSRYGGEPQWYVSHSWSDSFLELVAALVTELAPPPGPAEPEYPVGHKEGIFVYLDIFAQTYRPSVCPGASEAASITPAEIDRKIKLAMSICKKGLILILDRKGECLTRSWILYEVFLFCRERRADVNIALPGGKAMKLSVNEVTCLKEALTQIDISRTKSARSQDYTYVLSHMRHIMGVQRSNALLSETLSFVIQCKLRWQGGVWYKARLPYSYNDYKSTHHVLYFVFFANR